MRQLEPILYLMENDINYERARSLARSGTSRVPTLPPAEWPLVARRGGIGRSDWREQREGRRGIFPPVAEQSVL